ncbi:hypothetical protein JTB14_037736 [Gonioctena quinquepunctata]|nr:hypothetical protein JTB14_037736 [Gonioctena quinquepunctata]
MLNLVNKCDNNTNKYTETIHQVYLPLKSRKMEQVDQFSDSDEDQDEFEDAEDIPIPNDMTLNRALEESQRAINYFFNNQFKEARDMMTPYCTSSMYHSLGNSVFCYMEAILTFERDSIAIASKSLKATLSVCNRYRKKNTISESIGKMVKRAHFDQYTELEAHAELCHAESLLLKSMLTFMEDETLGSFIKAGLKIRSCFNSYKDCRHILTKRSWDGNNTKDHFESGVRMGMGAFNLMISMLPSRVVKLLEFIGFSGNKQNGLNDLTIGCEINGLRQILCIMTMLGYNLVVLHVLSHKEGDIKMCQEIIDEQLKKHPDSVWFLFFQGRLNLLLGKLQASQEMYTKSWKSQNVWPQFHHICFWELVWVHCLKTEWRQALVYCTQLLEKNDLTPSELEEMDQLMRDVPKYKQRIAGKSLPMEKFAIKRAERYLSQNRCLVLPVLEIMFFWNLFKILKNFSVATKILKLIENSLENIDSSKTPSKYDNDNKALILLLQGACFRHMGSPLLALECFESVISMQKNLVEDHFIIPYAIVELALVEWQTGNREKAILALEDAKKNYTGYSLESRLHFRIHTSLSEFKAEIKNSP